jgi:hypothetical protein
MLPWFNPKQLSLNVAKDKEVMRNRLSRCTLLGITVTIASLLLTGCSTSSWSTWSWPGTSWLTGKKAPSSEYQTPDKPSSGYSSLPVDQAQKYPDPQSAPVTSDPQNNYPQGNPAVIQNNNYSTNYPATNQGNSNYLAPAETQQPVDPYITPPVNQAQQGPYNANLFPNNQGSPLLPPASTPITAGGFQTPAVDLATPVPPLSPDDSNYNQGFYKPGQGQFGTPFTQDTDSFPINQGGTITPAQPVVQEPVYTGQLPASNGTQIDGLPTSAVPAGLPTIPAPGTYRPGSTGSY